MVAERMKFAHQYKTPIIEATGTGGGVNLFCRGNGHNYPDIVAASRKIKPTEIALCEKNGITDFREVLFGYDAIVLVHSIHRPQYKFTLHHLFLAISKYVPVKGTIIENPYGYWDEIDIHLPHTPIEIYAPPTSSGTRESFVDMVMTECLKTKDFLEHYDNEELIKICKQLRNDNKLISVGENDNLVIQKMVHNTSALGILSYNFLAAHTLIVQGAQINGITPSTANIARKLYPLVRPFYLYVKRDAHAGAQMVDAFLDEAMSERAVGKDGYLIRKGLISAKFQ
jgi:phosphate transport system substrate-binding protein